MRLYLTALIISFYAAHLYASDFDAGTKKDHTLKTLTDKPIKDALLTHYGIEVGKLTMLPIGADINASVYRAETQQMSYFVKIKTSHHQGSTAIVDLLQKAGIEEIIYPVKTIDGHSSLSLDGFTVFVYPYIQGQDGFTRPLNDGQRFILGKTLRQIHDLKVPPVLQQQIRKETYSPQWRDAVRSIYSQNNQAQEELALKLWDFLQKNQTTINQIVDRAEELAHKLSAEPLEFVLCHSDMHGGNILMDDERTYIVDWDEPIMAPKERDLMFIGAGIDRIWTKPHEIETFYEGYGKTKINMTALAYYRHERIVEDIAVYSQEILFTDLPKEDKLVMFGHFMDMFKPGRVVEIAFKTPEK